MFCGGVPLARAAGKPMRASSAATTMSHISARSVPPARQLPWTCAMTGLWMSNIEIVFFWVCSSCQQSSSTVALADR